MDKVLRDPQIEQYAATRFADPSIPSPYLPALLSKVATRKTARETLVKSVLPETRRL